MVVEPIVFLTSKTPLSVVPASLVERRGMTEAEVRVSNAVGDGICAFSLMSHLVVTYK